MRVYYNDIDPFVCDWLHNLMAAGEIPRGEIDDRPIEQVQPSDVASFDQVHLFAGIGGWPEALRIAGFRDRPIWTASCPCPPFSAAGKKRVCPSCQSDVLVWCPGRTGYAICADCGHAWLADARHLWPEVWRLLAFCRPECIAGEQVAGPAAFDWLAAVCASLEILRYDPWAVDIPASGVGAPNIRQRIAWLAYAQDIRRERQAGAGRPAGDGPQRRGGLVYAGSAERRAVGSARGETGKHLLPQGQEGAGGPRGRGEDGGMVHAHRARSLAGDEAAEAAGHGHAAPAAGRLGDPIQSGLEGFVGHGDGSREPGRVEAEPGGSPAEAGAHGRLADTGRGSAQHIGRELAGATEEGGREARQQRVRDDAGHGGTDGRMAHAEGVEARAGIDLPEGQSESGEGGFWGNAEWVLCREPTGEKWRPIEPGTQPVAHGVQARVGRLRAYGNAINPHQFAAFLEIALAE